MLRPFDVKTPAGRRALGEAAVQGRSDGRHLTPQGATDDLLAVHFCCCRPGVPCIFCLRWSRKIAGIEARRADPIWQQVPERRVASGGL